MTMTKDMPFGRKIFMLFAGLVAIVIAASLVVGTLYYKVNVQQSELLEQRLYSFAQIRHLISLAQKVESSGAHFIITGGMPAFQDFLAAHQIFDKEMRAAVADPRLADHRPALESLLEEGRRTRIWAGPISPPA
ncbi:MAG: hypothetical protein KF802_14560 [Bdellovibrionaceae bacterium]|nr:hypothetical protein [Pseudobdellovibrionaceae bacterium]